MSQTGVLLINLGTPDDPALSSVRRYLREFLLDPRVIDLPVLIRYLLVYGIILPFRTPKTLHAYQTIWTEKGSPLRIHTENLTKALSQVLGNSYKVVYGMRYGNPSIDSAIPQLQSCKHVIVLPLFPQYSSAATGSALTVVFQEYAKQWNIPRLTIIDSFYQEEGFIKAYAELIKPYLDLPASPFLLLSYHGLPERHLHKSRCESLCHAAASCPAISDHNQFCYRAQCYATSKKIASQLSLSEDRYLTSFQSRLGRTPWIKPYTDEQLITLRKQGINNLVIACPAFVADCLETLEEIGLRARAQWQALGGNSFNLIPCLNAQPLWVKAIANIIQG
ncbi:MAG: hemH [Gammaproteobacteria bacterium]|jgi:ferrochelatase|nr:hemH [Gammaproteobacteria bacterium]